MRYRVESVVTTVFEFEAEDFRLAFSGEWKDEGRPDVELWIPRTIREQGVGILNAPWVRESDHDELNIMRIIQERVG